MFYQLEDFRMDLRKTLTPDSGVWVTSGYSTCAPRMGTVTAVKGCFSPPFAAPDELLEMEFIANNHTVGWIRVRKEKMIVGFCIQVVNGSRTESFVGEHIIGGLKKKCCLFLSKAN